MSSRRTMVDRLDAGDPFTYALLSLIALAADGRSIAQDAQPHLRLVGESNDDQTRPPEGVQLETAILGLISLGDLAARLIPDVSTDESTGSGAASLRPRELLR